jgi:hypothetical protein
MAIPDTFAMPETGNPETRVVYGYFYFFMSEALLRTESGSGSGSVHNRRFPLFDSPAA